MPDATKPDPLSVRSIDDDLYAEGLSDTDHEDNDIVNVSMPLAELALALRVSFENALQHPSPAGPPRLLQLQLYNHADMDRPSTGEKISTPFQDFEADGNSHLQIERLQGFNIGENRGTVPDRKERSLLGEIF